MKQLLSFKPVILIFIILGVISLFNVNFFSLEEEDEEEYTSVSTVSRKSVEYYTEFVQYDKKGLEELQSIPKADYRLGTDRLPEAKPAFENIGPYNVGGRTKALAIDITNEDIIMAGGVTGGLWRSEDGGEHWVRITSTERIKTVSAIVQDTRRDFTNRWYIATGECELKTSSGNYVEQNAYGSGIYYSDTKGLSWEKLETPSRSLDLSQSLAVNPLNGDLFIACEEGIFRITYEGEFSRCRLNFENVQGKSQRYADVVSTPEGQIIASYLGNVFYRDLIGDWHRVEMNNLEECDRVVIGASPSLNRDGSRKVYYFGVSKNHNPKYRLYHQLITESAPGEVGMRRVNGIYNIRDMLWDVVDWSEFGFGGGAYNQCIAVKPDDPNVVLLGSRILYRSTDGFKDPANVEMIGRSSIDGFFSDYPSVYHLDQHKIIFYPSNPRRILVGNDGGVYRSNNVMKELDWEMYEELDWQPLNNGYLTTQAYSVSIPEGDSKMIAAGFQDNGTQMAFSNEHGYSWVNTGNNDGMHCVFNASGSRLITSHQKNYFNVKIIDEGEREREHDYGISTNGNGFDNKSGMAAVFLPGTNGKFFIIKDGNSVRYYPDINDEDRVTSLPDIPEGELYTLAISTEPAYILYAATKGRDAKIYRYTNATSRRASIEEVSVPEGATEGSMSCITVDPLDANRIFAVYAGKGSDSDIFYSKDGGQRWRKITANLDETSISARWLTIHRMDSRPEYYRIFLGTSHGLFSTNDIPLLNGGKTKGSITWRREAVETIGCSAINRIVSRPSDGLMAIATYGNGIFTGYAGLQAMPTRLKRDLGTIQVAAVDNNLEIDLSSYVSFEEEYNFRLTSQSDEEVAGVSLDENILTIDPRRSGANFVNIELHKEGEETYEEGLLKIMVTGRRGDRIDEVLYDQSVAGKQYYKSSENRLLEPPSQDIQSYKDEFRVPKGQGWDVEKVMVKGSYEGRLSQMERVRISIVEADSIYYELVAGQGYQPRVDQGEYSFSRTYDIDASEVSFRNGNFTFYLEDEDIHLQPGKYYLSISPVIIESNKPWKWRGDSEWGNAIRGAGHNTEHHLWFRLSGKYLGRMVERSYHPPKQVIPYQEGENSIIIPWQENQDNAGDRPRVVEVERSEEGVNGYTPLATLRAEIGQYVDENVLSGKRYNYRVRYKAGSKGQSRYVCTEYIQIKRAPLMPQDFRILQTGEKHAVLVWEPDFLNPIENRVDGFKLYRKVTANRDNSMDGFHLIADLEPNQFTYYDEYKLDNNYVHYLIKPYNIAREDLEYNSDLDAYSCSITKPLSPSNIEATVLENNDVRISWKDESRNEVKYSLYSCDSAGNNNELIYEIRPMEDGEVNYSQGDTITFVKKNNRGFSLNQGNYFKILTLGRSQVQSSRTRVFQAKRPVFIDVNNGFNFGFRKSNLVTSEKLKVYPNPFTGNRLNIELPDKLKFREAQVTITDLSGKETYTSNISFENKLGEIEIFGKINPGVYMVIIEAGHESFVEKIVVE